MIAIIKRFLKNLIVTFVNLFIELSDIVLSRELKTIKHIYITRHQHNPSGFSLAAIMTRVMRKLMNEKIERGVSIHNELEAIFSSKNRIIIGPWLSEVGFELLYWIPFVKYCVAKYDVDPSRLIIVTRGGADIWYGLPNAGKIDIFSLFENEEFFEKNQKRIELSGHQKHMGYSEFDVEIINKVELLLSGETVSVIHPSLMYNLFIPFWRRQVAPNFILEHSIYSALKIESKSAVLAGVVLPKSYSVVKFYYSDALPETNENKNLITEIINYLAERQAIVLLESPIGVDDHVNFNSEKIKENIIKVSATDFENNLAFQTKLIANADHVFATYGGLSYVPALQGVAVTAVYSEIGRIVPIHLDMALRYCRALTCGKPEKNVKNGENMGRKQFTLEAIHIKNLHNLLSNKH